MAVVTITITDDETGGCQMQATSVPDVPDNDAECTPAQLTGALVMKVIDAIIMQAQSHLEGEGE
jgi:hypothetical protein